MGRERVPAAAACLLLTAGCGAEPPVAPAHHHTDWDGGASPDGASARDGRADVHLHLERDMEIDMDMDTPIDSGDGHEHGDASADAPAAPSSSSLTRATPALLHYHARWSWEGATFDEGSRSYRLVTARGATVTVARWEVALASVGLVSCVGSADGGSAVGTPPDATASLPARDGTRIGRAGLSWFRDGLLSGLGELNPFRVGSARADHGVNLSESFLSTPFIEAGFVGQASPASQHIGERPLEPASSCQLFQSFGPVDDDPSGWLHRQSLRLVGSYQVAGAAAATPLEVTTALGVGGFVPLEVTAPADGAELRVVLERRPVEALLAADFTQSGPDVAYELFRLLARTTRALVDNRPR